MAQCDKNAPFGVMIELNKRFRRICASFSDMDTYILNDKLKRGDMAEFRIHANVTILDSIEKLDAKNPLVATLIEFMDFINEPLTLVEIIDSTLSAMRSCRSGRFACLNFADGKYVLVSLNFLLEIESEYFQSCYSGRWVPTNSFKFDDFHVGCGLFLKYMAKNLSLPHITNIRLVAKQYHITCESVLRQLIKFADAILWRALKLALLSILFKEGYSLTKNERIEIGANPNNNNKRQ
jgi:hypothetical protein